MARVWCHKVQRTADISLHFFAVDDGIEHAVFEEEFAALESGWKFLADSLFDYAWAGEAYQRARFGNVEISEHREGRSHATGGRVGENRDKRHASFVELGQCGGNFCQLHQAEHAFHHASAAGCRNNDERLFTFERLLDGAGNHFSDNRSHAAADKAIFHGTDDYGPAI